MSVRQKQKRDEQGVTRVVQKDISSGFDQVRGAQTADPVSALSGQDDEAISEVFDRILKGKIREQYSDRNQAAVQLFMETEEILNTKEPEEAETIFQDSLKDMSIDDRLVYAKLRTTGHSLHTAAAFLSSLNIPDDAEHNTSNLEAMVHLYKDAGVPVEHMEHILASTVINMAITPHPTEHLTSKGIARFKELIDMANVPESEREIYADHIIERFLNAPIMPERNLSIEEENAGSEKQAEVHLEALRLFYRERLKPAIEHAYAGEESKPDLRKIGKHINLIMHTWSSGGDADGKANAERLALMSGVVGMVRQSVSGNLMKHLSTGKGPLHYAGKTEAVQKLDRVLQTLDQLQDNVNSLKLRSVEKGSDYGYNDFEQLERDFESMFDGINLPEPEYGRISPEDARNGKGLAKQIERELSNIIDEIDDEDLTESLEETLFILQSHGFTATKVDFRHNGLVYKEIMNDLFEDQVLLERAGISDADVGKMAKRGGFSALDEEKQRTLLLQVHQTLSGEEIREALWRSHHPLEYDDNGLPDQRHEFLMRFELMSKHPDLFGRAIMAEADSMSALYQALFARAFDIKGMEHMPLNEDLDNIWNAPKSMEDFLNEAKEYKELGIDTGTYMQMLPQSDVIKALGPFGRILTANTAQEIGYLAAKMGHPTLLMWGNGLANERGGGNPAIAWRYMAQGVQKYLDERAESGGNAHLDINDEHDRKILEMMTYQSSTEQGRAVRMLNATPEQIARKYGNTMSEMMGRCLELQGKVKRGTFIPPRDKFSKKLDKFLYGTMKEDGTRERDGAYVKAMMCYSDYREALPEEGERKVTDSWADQASNPEVATMQNNSARANSKSSGAKNLTKQRAIGSNNWLALARTHHDGWYTVGGFLQMLHEARQSGELDDRDIEDFMKSEYWDFNIFSTSLNPAARSDLSLGFRKLGVAITHDEAMEIAENVQVRTETVGDKEKSVFIKAGCAQEVSDEVAYQAVLYAEHFRFLAMTEALVKGEFNKDIDLILNDFRPDDGDNNIVKVKPGMATRDRWQNLDKVMEAQKGGVPELVLADLIEEENRSRMEKGAEPHEEYVLRAVGAAAKSPRPPHHAAFVHDHVFGTLKHLISTDMLIEPPENVPPAPLDEMDIH